LVADARREPPYTRNGQREQHGAGHSSATGKALRETRATSLQSGERSDRQRAVKIPAAFRVMQAREEVCHWSGRASSPKLGMPKIFRRGMASNAKLVRLTRPDASSPSWKEYA
jgi:hypothetical protein